MKAPVKNLIVIAFIIVAVVGGYIAFSFYRKAKSSEKIKLGEVTLVPEKKIDNLEDLVEIFQNGLKLRGNVTLRNFSNTDFTINQMSLDCLSPTMDEVKIIAEQTNIMAQNYTLLKRATGQIPLKYTVDVLKVLKLFKESGVIPEDYTVWQIVSHPAQAWEDIDISKLSVRLKGFVQAEGITIDIDEIIPLNE